MDKLLAKKPEQRFQSARELIDLLTLSANNTSLLASGAGTVKSVQLVKSLGNLIAQDFKLFAEKSAGFLNKLRRQIFTSPIEPTIITGSQLEQTLVTAPANTAPVTKVNSITEVFNDSRNKVRWVHGSLGLLVFIAIGFIFFDAEPSTNTREQWAQLSANTSGSTKNSSSGTFDNTLPLTINPVPAEAQVRILNIKEKYSVGMLLAPAAYHIEISHPG